MKRRQLLQAAGIGLAPSTIAAPAIAQSMPEIKWRLTSSFPKSLDTLYGAAEIFSKSVAEATDNRFQIQTFAAFCREQYEWWQVAEYGFDSFMVRARPRL